METKVCTQCKKELPIEEFNWRDKKRGIRRANCKYCQTEYMKNAYMKKKKLVSEIKSNMQCQKCGECREYVLDFHHVEPNKKENTVARMTSNAYRIDKILEEVKKCIVLCSNCHREFHYLQEKYNITLNEYLNDQGVV